MSLPIGFLDSLGSGKVRKWVQESTQSTETYLAHQLPETRKGRLKTNIK